MFAERFRSIKNAALGVVLAGCAAYFLSTVHQHYAVWDWLVWRYIGYWLASAVWALSCLGYGLLVLRVLRVDLREDDSWVLAFPLGVFVFHLLVFLVGLAQLLRPAAFVCLPLVGVAAGGQELLKQLNKCRSQRRTLQYSALPVFVYGLYGVALLYFQLLTPETFSYDARWYHLPIAQQYAADGAVRAWPEGWWLAAYPHLSSYLYAWAFLLPGSAIFDRYELSAHMEVMIFLATIGSIPALVRRLVPATQAKRRVGCDVPISRSAAIRCKSKRWSGSRCRTLRDTDVHLVDSPGEVLAIGRRAPLCFVCFCCRINQVFSY